MRCSCRRFKELCKRTRVMASSTDLSIVYPNHRTSSHDGVGLIWIHICSFVSLTASTLNTYRTFANNLNIKSQCRNAPTLLKLIVTDMYVISGPENITALFKQPDLNTKIYRSLSFRTMCKMPKDALAFWMSDDSGMLAQPHPDSHVPAHLRVDYMTHLSIAKLLAGVGLKPLCDRFTRNLSQRLLADTSIGGEWVQHPDLFVFMRNELFVPAVEAIWGSSFVSINPDFGQDLWRYSRGLPYLAKGYPRWLAPSAYNARDKCLESVKHWHRAISSSLETPARGHDQWNTEYGIRNRVCEIPPSYVIPHAPYECRRYCW